MTVNIYRICSGRNLVMLIVVSIVFLLVYIVTDIGNSISDDIDKESMQSSALRRSPLTSKILLRKDSGAVCLDGSPPAYYLREGRGDGQTKWFVFFEGGGWCYDPKQCWLRSKTILGSSKDYPASIDKLMKFYLSSSKRANPLMYNWNTVYVRYCDGGSFAGDATIEYEGNQLHFKGKTNRDETIKDVLQRGMDKATEVVIGGCSAGGLAVYLGIDQMSSIIREINPSASVRGLADSGIFLDHSSKHAAKVTYQKYGRDEASINGMMDYGSAMKSIYTLMNITSGTNPACLNAHHTGTISTPIGDVPSHTKCIFAGEVAPFIQTPVFALQPRFDQWQIRHVVGEASSVAEINEMGMNLTKTVSNLFLGKNKMHGAFVDSCTHHCTSCSHAGEDSWNGERIKSTEEVTAATAFAVWYQKSFPLTVYSGANLTTGLSVSMPKSRMFLQDKPYPCDDCCICRLAKR